MRFEGPEHVKRRLPELEDVYTVLAARDRRHVMQIQRAKTYLRGAMPQRVRMPLSDRQMDRELIFRPIRGAY